MSSDPEWLDAKLKKRPLKSSRRLKVILAIPLFLALSFGGLMLFKAYKSRQQNDWGTGLKDGQLQPCGAKPNCVSSVNSPADSGHFIEPITSESPEALEKKWSALVSVLKSENFEIVREDPTYIHATETTSLLRFVDDMEFLKNSEDLSIEIKSKSRVGHSDLGANRKRLKRLKARIAKI